MSQKKRSKLKTVLIVLGVITAISAITNIINDSDNNSNIRTSVVADTTVNAIQDEENNKEIVQNVVETQSVETISVENQDKDTINKSNNTEIQNEKTSYLSLNGTIWTAVEDNLLSTNRKYDVELIFNDNRYKLTIKDSIGKVIQWQHENRYEIDDENLIFSLKLGEKINGNITDDNIIITNWSFGNKNTYELKRQ
jgi:hypothetical protein